MPLLESFPYIPLMQYVLTLIAGSGSLDNSTIDKACAAVAKAGARVGGAEWLADGHACDILFDGLTPAEASAEARDAVHEQPIDLVAQPVAGRRKKLLLADMESTIIDNEMIDELAGELGLHDRMADLTARTMRGELDFAESLAERVRMLEGLDISVLGKMSGRIRINPGAAELVATMRSGGARCALVSGGFTFYSDDVRNRLGFDYSQANRLEIVNGKLTGRVVKPVLDRHAKQAFLMQLAAELGLTLEETLAVGDGANDLGMVLAAGLGVAYHGKPILAEAAAMRVDYGDLTALLFAQGYRLEEIVRH